jgi:hypothetical protein
METGRGPASTRWLTGGVALPCRREGRGVGGAVRAWNWEGQRRQRTAVAGLRREGEGDRDGENEKEEYGVPFHGGGTLGRAIVALGLLNGRWIEGFGVWTRSMGSTSGDG